MQFVSIMLSKFVGVFEFPYCKFYIFKIKLQKYFQPLFLTWHKQQLEIRLEIFKSCRGYGRITCL